VVDSAQDQPEIQKAVEQIGGVSAEKVMLMPQAKTREELIAKSPMVAQMCKETGYVFCHRLHILLYDGVRGK
jgi:7-carboxy-7-deazaguanine synthase